MESSDLQPIAIVGLACRLPGADDLESFWQMIMEGRSGLGELQAPRFDREIFYDSREGVLGKSYTMLGGVVSDRPVNQKICPISDELRLKSNSSQLILCELTAVACRDAGIDPMALSGRNVGVYLGHTPPGGRDGKNSIFEARVAEAAQNLYDVPAFCEMEESRQSAVIDDVVVTCRHGQKEHIPSAIRGNASHAAALISEVYGLSGPSMAFDAACASSLRAFAHASRALQLGEIEMAVAGSGSSCNPEALTLFSAARSVSRSGSCPFDDASDGLVTAEGFAIAVLKRLDDAILNKDPILAVVRGIGISSDGRGKSLWAPRKEGQIEAVRRAYGVGVEMSKVQFVEAHATSTQVGDATELAALSETLREKLPANSKIPIGSVKANIGHTLETAGLASLIKTVLAIRHRVIPPQINLRQLNSRVNWQSMPFYVPTEPTAWPEQPDGSPRRAAINAFGIGGLNIHVVIDEYVPGTSYAAKIPSNGLVVRRQTPEREPIAIVGRGAVLPGVRTIDRLWDLVCSGQDQRTIAPRSRWFKTTKPADEIDDSHLNLPFGGFITDFQYDWKRNKVPPKQVAMADPLQFMLLDAAAQALSEAGGLEKNFDRKLAGVIVGTTFGSEFCHDLQVGLRLPEFVHSLELALHHRGVAAGDVAKISKEFARLIVERLPAIVDETGSFTASTLSSRITKTFDLMGGAVSVDAGDASGLAALQLCVQMLRSKECRLMVCAAGQRSLSKVGYDGLARLGHLPKAGGGAPFDLTASGMFRAEGSAVVVLKRLSDAVADGNKVFGVIHGIGAARTDHRSASIELAIQRAKIDSNVRLEEISMVSAAGTGIAAHDKDELAAIVRTYGEVTRSHPLLVSSMAGQIGSLEGGSGIVSLLKTTAELDHVKSFSTVGLKNPIPTSAPSVQLLWKGSQQLQPVSNSRLFGAATAVSDYSLAYHVIVERGAPVPASTLKDPASFIETGESSTSATRPLPGTPRIVRLSAQSWSELMQLVASAKSIQKLWSKPSEPFRADRPIRLAIVAQDLDDLEHKRQLAVERGHTSANRIALAERGIVFGEATSSQPRIAFLFPGQGSQYGGMLQRLVQEYRPAALAMNRIDAVLTKHQLPTFSEMAWKDDNQLDLGLLQAQLMALSADLIFWESLSSLGIQPDRVSGHSLGEIPALVAAGAWTVDQAVVATVARSRAVAGCPAGSLFSSRAPAELVKTLISEVGGQLFLSHQNAPDQTVVAGEEKAVKRMVDALRSKGFAGRLLRVPAPFHTPMLADAKPVYRKAIESLSILPPMVPLLSTVNNRFASDPHDILDNLVEMLVTPLNYVDHVRRLVKSGTQVLIEVGPRQVLTGLHKSILGQTDVTLMATDNKSRPGLLQLLLVRAHAEVIGAVPPVNKNLPPVDSFEMPTEPTILSVAPKSDGSGKPDGQSGGFKTSSSVIPLSVMNQTASADQFREQGLIHGQKLRTSIRTALRRLATGNPAPTQNQVKPTSSNGRTERMFSDNQLAELEGMAAGVGVPVENLIALRFTSNGRHLLDYTAHTNGNGNGHAGPDNGAIAPPTRRQTAPVPLNKHPAGPRLDRSPEPVRSSDVCQRIIVEMVEAPYGAPQNPNSIPTGRALIVGSHPAADALQKLLIDRGIPVERLFLAQDLPSTLQHLEQIWKTGPVQHLFLMTSCDSNASTELSAANWDVTREQRVMQPYLICQRWFQLVLEAKLVNQVTMTASANLGGDFGLSGKVTNFESGGIAGLLKAIAYEVKMTAGRMIPTKVVDFSAGTGAAVIAKSLFDEWLCPDGEIEVGFVDGRRFFARNSLAPVPAPIRDRNPEGIWIIAGGARGITAEIARSLAKRHRLVLHLLGSSPEPKIPEAWHSLSTDELQKLKATISKEALARREPPATAWEKVLKQIEIDRNLRKFRSDGVNVTYHQCDLGSREAVSEMVAKVRADGGPISGLMYGAGFESAGRFEKRKADIVRKTLAAKVDGLAALLDLTKTDPLTHVIGFSSVSGRFGAVGQTDYCVANEMLAKMVNSLRAKRSGCQTAVFHWHAWDEVGMAARPESRRYLESIKFRFLPLKEGVRHLLDEVAAGLPNSEVIITSADYVKKFHEKTGSSGESATAQTTTAESPAKPPTIVAIKRPLIERLTTDSPDRFHAEIRLDPTRDPFLIQHLFRQRPLLPIVVGMESMAQAVQTFIGPNRCVTGLRNFETLTGMRFLTDDAASAKVSCVSRDGIFRCELTSDFYNSKGKLIQPDRAHMRAIVETADVSPSLRLDAPKIPTESNPVIYRDDAFVIYHGPIFRCLNRIQYTPPGTWGTLLPAPVADFAGQRGTDGWLLPCQLLDACLFACGVCAWYDTGAVTLPNSFTNLEIARCPRADENCFVYLLPRGREGKYFVYDFSLTDEQGNVLLQVNGMSMLAFEMKTPSGS